jgi:hypothetical protein
MSPQSPYDHPDWLGGEALVRDHGRHRRAFASGGLPLNALILGLVFLAGLMIGASVVILWQSSRHTVREQP